MRAISFLATLILALSFSRPAIAASAAPDFTLVQALFTGIRRYFAKNPPLAKSRMT